MPSLADNQYSSVLRPALWLWALQRRRWPVCGCPAALWHPRLWFWAAAAGESECPSTFSTEPRSNEQLVSPLNPSPQREIWSFSRLMAQPCSQALRELMDHWIWLLSFVVLPFYLPHSPSEMGQGMSRSQKEQNLPKFKLMHKNLTPLWCN